MERVFFFAVRLRERFNSFFISGFIAYIYAILSGDPRGYNMAATNMAEMGFVSIPEYLFIKVTEKHPTWGVGYRNLSVFYCRLNLHDLAEKCARVAIALEGKKKDSVNVISSIYVAKAAEMAMKGYLPNAIHFLDKVLEVNPNDVFVHLQKFVCYMQMGNHEASLQCLCDATSRDYDLARNFILGPLFAPLLPSFKSMIAAQGEYSHSLILDSINDPNPIQPPSCE